MSVKRYRADQLRRGNPRTRRLEFEVIKDQVTRRKDAFTARLQRLVRTNKNGCVLGKGSLDHKGYPRMNFKYKGRHVTIHMMRVFLILKTCAPIPVGYDTGHIGCKDRRCVRHIELQPYRENCVTNGSEAP